MGRGDQKASQPHPGHMSKTREGHAVTQINTLDNNSGTGIDRCMLRVQRKFLTPSSDVQIFVQMEIRPLLVLEIPTNNLLTPGRGPRNATRTTGSRAVFLGGWLREGRHSLSLLVHYKASIQLSQHLCPITTPGLVHEL